MAKFTASVPLNIRLPGGFEAIGVAGTTHRIPDALAEEFARDQAPLIPGFAWVTQDETSAIPTLPIAQANVSNLVSDLAGKYDKTGGTISGAVTITGALVAQSTVSAVGAITGSSVIANAVTATTAVFKGSPWLDAKAYGAVGDGSTDDTTALQLAINALTTAAINAEVFIPAGTYKITSSLTLPFMQYKTIRGSGMAATVIQATMTNSPIFKTTAEDTHSITIRDIGLDYSTQRSSSNTQAAGILFSSSSAGIGDGWYHWRVSNVSINRAAVGIGIDQTGSGSLPVWGSMFDRIVMTGIAYRGVNMIPLSGGQPLQTWIDLKINNNGTTVGATDYAFYASGAEINMTDFDVESWRGPVFYNDGGLPSSVRGIHIEHHTAASTVNLIEIANSNLAITGIRLQSLTATGGAVVTVFRVGATGSLNVDGARISATFTSGSGIWASQHSTASALMLRSLVDDTGLFTLARLGQPFVGPLAPWLANTNNAPTLANQALLYAFTVPSAVRVTKAVIQVNTASGNVDFGLYDANGTRLSSTGSTALSGGSQSAALSAAVLLNPGKVYYAAIACSSVSASLADYGSVYPSSTGNFAIAVRVDSSFPLPSTIALGTSPAQRYFPVIFET